MYVTSEKNCGHVLTIYYTQQLCDIVTRLFGSWNSSPYLTLMRVISNIHHTTWPGVYHTRHNILHCSHGVLKIMMVLLCLQHPPLLHFSANFSHLKGSTLKDSVEWRLYAKRLIYVFATIWSHTKKVGKLKKGHVIRWCHWSLGPRKFTRYFMQTDGRTSLRVRWTWHN